jgi:TRAP-type mannitol/chloroaromatic compound transport system permease small subunit
LAAPARLLPLLDRLSETIGRFVSWLTLLMVLITFAVVVLRYVFDMGWIALQESVVFLHGTVFMLGAAYALQRDGHVRVDIFYRRRSERGRALTDLLGTLLLLLPTCGFILWVGWDYVADAWAVREGSREAGGLPGVFLYKTLILLMPALLLVQGLSTVLGATVTLARRSGTGDEVNRA